MSWLGEGLGGSSVNTRARENIVLAAILARADGRIEITDAELLEVNLSAKLHIWRDPSRHVSIIELADAVLEI
jgi:hypothetical protein